MKSKTSAKSSAKKTSAAVRAPWNAECVARWYGFIASSTPGITPEDRKIAASIRKDDTFTSPGTLAAEELVRVLLDHRESEWFDKPYAHMQSYRKSPSAASWARGKETLTLHAIGCDAAVADATLIKAAYSSLHEEGVKNLCVRLSTVGHDPRGAFARELSAFLRKRLGDMTAAGRDLAKSHPFAFVAGATGADTKLLDEMPSPLSFLVEEDRRRFGEVVEFLEAQQVPYEIDPRIVPDPATSAKVSFRIEADGETVAAGARYDGLAKRVGFKADLHAAYATIALKKPKLAPGSCHFTPEDASFYLLQIGSEAKRRAHLVLDVLRKARIPVYQSLDCDKLSTQLNVAKRFGFPYLVVVGAKEALDGTALIRDAESRSQEIVRVEDLPARLKEIGKTLGRR